MQECIHMRSFIGWVGGKSCLAGKIVKLFPAHKTYVEVFGGAGWVLFKKDPKISRAEFYNDINGDLVNLFRVVKHRPAELVERLNLVLHSRETFREFYNQELSPNDEVERAARFYYVTRSSFGCVPWKGWGYSKKDKPKTLRNLEFLTRISKRLENVYIDNRSYEKIIPGLDSKDTLFYLDPPYWIEGEKFYQHNFSLQDTEQLRAFLDKIKGKFILSYNDNPNVRYLYRGFKIQSTSPIHYSMNNKRKTVRRRSEIIISNF